MKGEKFTYGYVDTTYPREGTETPLNGSSALCYTGHNLSPRGDGNV